MLIQTLRLGGMIKSFSSMKWIQEKVFFKTHPILRIWDLAMLLLTLKTKDKLNPLKRERISFFRLHKYFTLFKSKTKNMYIYYSIHTWIIHSLKDLSAIGKENFDLLF